MIRSVIGWTFALLPCICNFSFVLNMEPLSYYLEARGLAFSEDIEFPVDLLARNKNLVKDLETKGCSDFYKGMASFDREMVDNLNSVETSLPNRMEKLLLDNPGLGAPSDKITDKSSDMIPSASIVSFDTSMWEGCASKIYSAAPKPHSRKDATIDPNLEKWTDSREPVNMPSSEENFVSLVVEDSSLAKRAQTTNLHPQMPLCQVHGCYKDLSFSKDYHKRHRVCDVHSKTAKVIINGIEKRFCQQCSRFHLLTEFDDGKRSCRKRLAGHNKRRRKPKLGAHLGSGFLEIALMERTPFLSPDTFPAGFFYQERFEKYNQSKHIELVEGLIDNSQLAVSAANGQSHISLADLHSIRKPLPSRACTDTAVAVEFSAHPDSNGALSLLSANEINHRACTRIDQNSAENLGTCALKGFAVDGYSSGTINQEGIQIVHDGSKAVSFKRQRDATFQVSEYRHASHRPSPEVATLNLLQLSSHLQRVEQQKNSGK